MDESGIATAMAGDKGSGIATAMAGTNDETAGFCFLAGFIAAREPGFTAVFAETGIGFVGRGATGPLLLSASSAN